ncbi:unnamed protein product [Sphagnum balticum]
MKVKEKGTIALADLRVQGQKEERNNMVLQAKSKISRPEGAKEKESNKVMNLDVRATLKGSHDTSLELEEDMATESDGEKAPSNLEHVQSQEKGHELQAAKAPKPLGFQFSLVAMM